ncbi:MAG: PAS domain-containing protein [Clostridia bacterium]|nr:PAS domain-containing protein [Clostridia bacterium]
MQGYIIFRYRKLFENIPVGFLIADPSGKIVYSNKKAAVLTGMHRSGIAGKDLSMILEDIRAMNENVKADGGPGGENSSGFTAKLKREGETVYFEYFTEKLPGGLLAIYLYDASDKARLEQDLLLAQSRVRSAQTAGRIAGWEYDFGTGKIRASEETYGIFGVPYKDEDLVFDDILRFIRDKKAARKAFYDFIEKGKPYDVIYEINYGGGNETRTIYSYGHIVGNVQGLPGKAVGYLRDITNRINLQRRMDYEKEAFRRHLGFVGSVIVMLDLEGRVSFVNRKACEVLGHAEEAVIGESWVEKFIPERFRETVAGIRNEVLSSPSGDIAPVENPVITASAEERIIRWNNTTLVDEHGTVTGTLSSGEDITEIRLNEKRIAESENRLKEAEAMSHTGHWERDLASGRYIFSEELYRIFGFSADSEMDSADALHDRFHPEDAGRILDISEKAIRDGRDYSYEGRLSRPDGGTRYFRAEGKILKDEQGKPVKARGILSDITETKLYEQALVQNELRLRKAEEIARLGNWVMDLETGKYECSDGFLHICGLDPDTQGADYERIMAATHPGDRERIEKIILDSMKEGVDYDFENRILRPDGSIRHVRSKGTYIKDAQGKPVKSIGTLLDITDYKENEQRLLGSEGRLKRAEENAHVGHWERDYKKGVIYWSDEVYRIMGHKPQSFRVTGEKYNEFLHPDDKNYFWQSLEESINGMRPIDLECRIIDSGGEVKYIRVTGNARYEDGKAVETFGTIRNITETKLYENELLKKTVRLENAEAIAHVGNWERNLDNGSIYWSDEIYRILGCEPGEFIPAPGKDRDFIEEGDYSRFKEMFNRSAEGAGNFEIDIRAARKDGREIIARIKGGVAPSENGMKVMAGTIEDITDIKRHYEEIEYMNYHDTLTDLYNRRFFDEEFPRLDTFRNYPLAVIIADVNGLKMINDTMGHDEGDRMLMKTSRVLKGECGEQDVLVRLGGDDFILMLPRTTKSQAEIVLNRLHEAFSEAAETLPLSVSMGLAVKTNAVETKEQLIKEAEDSMYTSKLYEKTSKRGDLLRLIMDTLYERSSREQMHSERVSQYCGDMARVLRMPGYKVNELTALGLLHDIGKIAVRDSVLNKAGRLDDDEWEEIKKHPETGYRILSHSPGMQEASRYVLAHHEKWDGSGYPQGLKTYEIPLQARIMAIADAFDAMMSKRPYRDPLTIETAISEIKNGAGSQFDPDLAKVFVIEVLGKEW